MDSRIANKDKTILLLQLEELEPVFMGKKDEVILVWKILHLIAVHLYFCCSCLHNLLLPKHSGASYISGMHLYNIQCICDRQTHFSIKYVMMPSETNVAPKAKSGW